MFEKENKQHNNCKNVSTEDSSDESVYTIDDIQNYLGIGKTTVYHLLMAKVFHSVRVGDQYRISKNSFDTWLDSINQDINDCQLCD